MAALGGLLQLSRYLISRPPGANLHYRAVSFSAGSCKVSSNIYDINNCLWGGHK